MPPLPFDSFFLMRLRPSCVYPLALYSDQQKGTELYDAGILFTFGYFYCIKILRSSGLQRHQIIARFHPMEGKSSMHERRSMSRREFGTVILVVEAVRCRDHVDRNQQCS